VWPEAALHFQGPQARISKISYDDDVRSRDALSTASSGALVGASSLGDALSTLGAAASASPPAALASIVAAAICALWALKPAGRDPMRLERCIRGVCARTDRVWHVIRERLQDGLGRLGDLFSAPELTASKSAALDPLMPRLEVDPTVVQRRSGARGAQRAAPCSAETSATSDGGFGVSGGRGRGAAGATARSTSPRRDGTGDPTRAPSSRRGGRAGRHPPPEARRGVGHPPASRPASAHDGRPASVARHPPDWLVYDRTFGLIPKEVSERWAFLDEQQARARVDAARVDAARGARGRVRGARRRAADFGYVYAPAAAPSSSDGEAA
jgi:hypothetical protein